MHRQQRKVVKMQLQNESTFQKCFFFAHDEFKFLMKSYILKPQIYEHPTEISLMNAWKLFT